MKLRPYQQEALDRLAALDGKNALLCLPTGGGKTVCAAHLITGGLEVGKRTLYLAHRKELIRQPFSTLVRAGVPPEQLGVIMAGVGACRRRFVHGVDPAALGNRDLWRMFAGRRPPAPVQVASVDSLRMRKLPPADQIIVDEAHRSLAASYARILDAYPDAQVIGLSATPERTDGRGLDERYDELIVVATYKELAAQGYLVTPKVLGLTGPDLGKVRVVGGDYKADELSAAMLDERLAGQIVPHWLEHGQNAPTLGFAVDVEHSQRMVARFRDAGIQAAHVDGSTPTDERDRMLDDLARGQLKVLWNCDVATEGTDIPAVKTVISARPTKSRRVFFQQCGRGSRPHDSPYRFVILDHAKNAAEHGCPHFDREWTLKGRPKRASTRTGPLVWNCKACQTANELKLTECEECGAPRPVAERRAPEENPDVKLVPLGELRPEDLRDGFELIVYEWRAHNSKPSTRPRAPGWVLHRFKERYGQPPPAGCQLPEWTAEEAERRAEWDTLARERGQGFAAVRFKGRGYSPGDFLPPITTRWV